MTEKEVETMARPRQPISLIKAKGRSHKTKAEINEREESEVKGNNDDIKPPAFMRTKTEKQKFAYIAGELDRIGIMSNLDCDVLGRYIRAQRDWEKYSKLVDKMQVKLSKVISSDDEEDDKKIVMYSDLLTKYEGLRTKAFSQCQTCAASLGLTITSRCRLVLPKSDDKPKVNKFSKFRGA